MWPLVFPTAEEAENVRAETIANEIGWTIALSDLLDN
jgi:hypothetical protein